MSFIKKISDIVFNKFDVAINNKHIFILMVMYVMLSVFMLFVKENDVTGDEPHYLVMASGIIKHGSLEQTKPYAEEFKSRKIYKPGFAPRDAKPSNENTHAILGKNGLFNIHNIGLPLLLAVPFVLGGVIGTKLFIILLNSFSVMVAWMFCCRFSKNKNKSDKIFCVSVLMFSVPFLLASSQIYPDLLAGVISVYGLYWFFACEKEGDGGYGILPACIIAFLPWLQIKFSITCVILVVSISIKTYFKSKSVKGILSVFSVSFFSLLYYNWCAFGKIFGPYQSGAIETSKTSLMVFFGLFFDQNQGFLMTNPINLIGVMAVGWIYKLDRGFAAVFCLVFLSLLIPNSLHPNWYGGWSFSGRFGWSAAVVFIIPVVYGLLEVGRCKKVLFNFLVWFGAAIQLLFFVEYVFLKPDVYNKTAKVGSGDYSIFYHYINNFLPKLYNVEWAYRYVPNYVWLLFVCILLAGGFWPFSREGVQRAHRRFRGEIPNSASNAE